MEFFLRFKRCYSRIFKRVYYVTYPEDGRNSTAVSLFRTGNIFEIYWIKIQTSHVREKLYLTTLERERGVDLLDINRENEKE